MTKKLTRSEAARIGGLARAKTLTREHQRAAARKRTSESLAESGRKGAAATLEKYGYETLFRKCRKHRLKNPSGPELLMIGILSTLGLKYEREWRLGTSFYTVDFKLEGANKAIEVQGRIHRMLNVEERAARDAKKRELMMEACVEWLYITDKELLDVGAVCDKVEAFAGIAPRPARPKPIDPDQDCQWCEGKGYYQDSTGDEPIVKYDWVDCECRWRHLHADEQETEGALF